MELGSGRKLCRFTSLNFSALVRCIIICASFYSLPILRFPNCSTSNSYERFLLSSSLPLLLFVWYVKRELQNKEGSYMPRTDHWNDQNTHLSASLDEPNEWSWRWEWVKIVIPGVVLEKSMEAKDGVKGLLTLLFHWNFNLSRQPCTLVNVCFDFKHQLRHQLAFSER